MYIIIDGIDGIGKTTLVENLKKKLKADGKRVMFLREPGGTPIGEELRTILKDGNFGLDKIQELLLFSAARAATMEKIKNSLGKEADVILSDRSFLSTIAYQAQDDDDIRFVESITFELMQRYGTIPTKILILKNDDLEEVLSRKKTLMPAGDNFEDGKLSSMKARQDAYVNYYKKAAGRKFATNQMLLLDNTGLTPEQTFEAAKALLGLM